MKTPPLKLTIRQIRALQDKHGISNLLQPTPEDAGKLANLDFLGDFYYEGSRSWDAPPERDAVEDVPISDIMDAFKAAMSGDSPGKD